MEVKNKNTKMGILIAILVLAIGFATVTTTLYIRGTIKVAPDEQGFKEGVVFASASLESNAYSATDFAAISSITDPGTNGVTLIEFSTGALKTIGEKVTLTYTIKNKSSYKAKINNLNCKLFDNQGADFATDAVSTDGYLTVTPKNVLTGKVMAPNGSVTTADTVEIEMVKSYAGDGEKSYYVQCQLNVDTDETSTPDFTTAP